MLMELLVAERNLKIDQDGFKAAMQQQRERAQQASNFGTDYNQQLKSDQKTAFKGYDNDSYSATVVELFNSQDQEPVSN